MRIPSHGKQIRDDMAWRLRLGLECLVAFQPSVDYDITSADSIKTSIFGSEGLFLTVLTGPGSVWVQSLPFVKLASRIVGQFPRGKDSDSVLGGLGNLFEGE